MKPPASSLLVHAVSQGPVLLVLEVAPLVGAVVELVLVPVELSPVVVLPLLLSLLSVVCGFAGPQATSMATPRPKAATVTGAGASTSSTPQNGQCSSIRRT